MVNLRTVFLALTLASSTRVVLQAYPEIIVRIVDFGMAPMRT